jgi:hypothetical protein
MALNVVLISQRQSATGVALSWSPMEGVASYEVFVASKKLTPEELEACAKSGGSGDCVFAKLPGNVAALHDDISPEGEARYYGVAMLFSDGTVHAARVRAAAAPPAGAFVLSTIVPKQKATAKPAAPAPVAAPAPAPAAASAGASASEEDALEARKRQQREAREKMAGAAAEPPKQVTGSARLADLQKPVTGSARLGDLQKAPLASPKAATGAVRLSDLPKAEPKADLPKAEARTEAKAEAAPAEDPLEARKRTQREAREKSEGAAAASAPVSSEAPPQPAAVPLEESIDLHMHGATQTWDGLRIYWDRDPKAAAYEIIASDHQIFGDELRDALAGRADFTTATAVAPSVSCVIDNTTARDSRGWYAVLARYKDGARAAIEFKLGDAAESGKVSAPFLNPNRTGELRAEVEGLIADAREQWDRWKAEQDNGAKHEAKRMVGDALLMWPDYPAAKKLQSELN